MFAAGQPVRVSRPLANGWTREYEGVLGRAIEIGAPLVLILDSSRLMTSAVRTLCCGIDGVVTVETQHNPYTIQAIDDVLSSRDSIVTNPANSSRVSA